MINNLVNDSPLCGCKQPPKVITANFAICRCSSLVYAPDRPVGVKMPWDQWTASINPLLRAHLIVEAKRRIHHVEAFDPVAVRDAVAAARLANNHLLAESLEYEQWVASL